MTPEPFVGRGGWPARRERHYATSETLRRRTVTCVRCGHVQGGAEFYSGGVFVHDLDNRHSFHPKIYGEPPGWMVGATLTEIP